MHDVDQVVTALISTIGTLTTAGLALIVNDLKKVKKDGLVLTTSLRLR